MTAGWASVWPALLCCLALAGGAGAAHGASLQALDENGERLVSIPLAEGDGWCLGWNHSVAGFPVLDCYRYRDGRMWLERSHQPDFAAGLGHSPGRGEQVSDGRGGYWIENIDEPVPDNRYVLRVGSAAVDHRLIWREAEREREASLSAVAAGERVIIQLITNNEPDDV